MDKRNLALLAVAVVIAAAISYQVGVSRYQGQLEAKTEKVAQLERSLRELKSPATPPPKVSGAAEVVQGEDINCLICHDLDQTKSFHVPQRIMRIDERDGKRRRVCVDCHGPNGPPWSADEQQTPLSMAYYDNESGIIEITSEVPHGIHKRKIDSGVVQCQTCHGTGTKMVIPAPDTSKGHVLVCQNCKFHPENGNYITIHVELAGKKCTTCHTGGVIAVHQEKTKTLGQV
ncbi:MAG: hypothetical protein D6733_02245 [Methanobacteriota archaeon]|nr:MAG: hypothetical protein D6733_02245 [Euryarchaeota archaeon]